MCAVVYSGLAYPNRSLVWILKDGTSLRYSSYKYSLIYLQCQYGQIQVVDNYLILSLISVRELINFRPLEFVLQIQPSISFRQQNKSMCSSTRLILSFGTYRWKQREPVFPVKGSLHSYSLRFWNDNKEIFTKVANKNIYTGCLVTFFRLLKLNNMVKELWKSDEN